MLSQIFHLGEATGGREIPGLGLGGDARAALRGFVRVGGEAGRILLLPPAGPPCGEVAPRVGPWRCQAAPGTHGCPRAGRYSPCPVHFGSWQQPQAALKVENAGAWCGAALRWCWAGGAALASSPPSCSSLVHGEAAGPSARPIAALPHPLQPTRRGSAPPKPDSPNRSRLSYSFPSSHHPSQSRSSPWLAPSPIRWGSRCPLGGGRRRSCGAPRRFPFPELAAERHQVALTAPSAAGGARFTVNLLQRVNKPASANWH